MAIRIFDRQGHYPTLQAKTSAAEEAFRAFNSRYNDEPGVYFVDRSTAELKTAVREIMEISEMLPTESEVSKARKIAPLRFRKGNYAKRIESLRRDVETQAVITVQASPIVAAIESGEIKLPY